MSGADRPGDHVRTALADLWQEVLDCPLPGPQDDFLDQGGHSLAAVQLAYRVYDAFGVDLPLNTLLEHTVFEAMAARITEELVAGGDAVQVLEEVASLSDEEVRALLAEP